MKLLVATDAHIYKTPDGKHWAKSIYGIEFWERYLRVFDQVRIVARVKNIMEKQGEMLAVDNDKIEVYGIPFYQGPKQLLSKYIRIQKILKGVDVGCDAALLRLPSQTAKMTWKHLRKKIPLAGEIVYDITDDLNHRDRKNLFVRILNYLTASSLKKFCLQANGISYVTEHKIQENFPSYARVYGEDKYHFESWYSTITLKKDAFTNARLYTNTRKLKLAISSVSMNSDRKGEKVFIQIIKKLRERGYDVSGVLIGDGSMRICFEKMAEELGISENVEFTGLLPSSKDVRHIMEQADIFVFPTQGEGLPRGILEAMAIGLPVLSTCVGGIPEVISNEYLFLPNDVESFVNKIEDLINNPEELSKMSRENYMKSQEFRNDLLQQRRDLFYEKLISLCE